MYIFLLRVLARIERPNGAGGVRDQAVARSSMSGDTDPDVATRNVAAGSKWIARFHTRTEKIVKSVLRGEQSTDPLTVPVYSPSVGVVHVPPCGPPT